MEIIFNKESKRYGNDCVIDECYCVLEMFDKYLALHITHYSGWMGDEYDRKDKLCDTEEKAMKYLKKWGCEDVK